VRTCVFAGPSLAGVAVPDTIHRFGPVALGGVFRAVEAGYRRIGIIDGVFGNVPSVWHKEILFALSKGVEVMGAASMGALRAAELSSYGMIGIGRIYRMYRRGAWTDDDEVAIVHAEADYGYLPLSEPMANIRFTLRRLRRLGLLVAHDERALVAKMKELHFSQRGRDTLSVAMMELAGRTSPALLREFACHYVAAKERDARVLLIDLAGRPRRVTRPSWTFPRTSAWVRQFEDMLADVPRLPQPLRVP
jgi:hypothetical protein